MSATHRGPCPSCGSLDVEQIRSSKRNVEMRVGAAYVRFVRLYLERCRACGGITMYGKTLIGPFRKAYIPAGEQLAEA